MNETSKQKSYGIIAYVPTSGSVPRNDEAHFDGWYTSRGDADAIFQMFVKEYPAALVHVVERVHSEWRGRG